MSVEVLPVGVTCQLSCPYCYENPMRDAGNYSNLYDANKMIAALSKENSNFSIFGGEPLLTDIATLEKLWKWGFEKYKQNGIQTNGALITDEHVNLFEKYNVHVGISLDGPDELNDTRWAGTLNKTREMTKKTLEAIEKLIKINRLPSLIITLTKNNARKEKLPILKQWLQEMDNKNISSCRLHTLEIDSNNVSDTLALTTEENSSVLLEMAEFEKSLIHMRFDIFKDIKNILLGNDTNVTCTFSACDPYTTSAVRGVSGQGVRMNCNRSNKDGFPYVKSDNAGYERQLALYNTPQQFNGCKDCRFFVMCKGQCPGTGVNEFANDYLGDWRNRTVLCPLYMALFEFFEQDYLNKGILPISQSPQLKQIENLMVNAWESGSQGQIFNILKNTY